jgi:hypothetical protein
MSAIKSQKVVNIKNFKPENVVLSEIKLNKRNQKVVYINYKYSENEQPSKLRIQFPKMKIPFGISGWSSDSANLKGTEKSQAKETSTDSLEFSFDRNHPEYYKKIEEFEKLVLDFAIKNGNELFEKKKNTPVIIESNYTRNVRYSEKPADDGTPYPPRLKAKITKDEKFVYTTKFYDPTTKQRIVVDIYNYQVNLPKMSDVEAIFESGNVWFVNGKFGVSYRPIQAKVYRNENALEDYAFLESDNESDDESGVGSETNQDDDLDNPF